MAAENRFMAYSRYAIGEIVLVVIGILIALQINNWNESKVDHQVTLDYMENMLEDLKADLKLYEKFQNSDEIIYKLIDSITPAIKAVDRKENVSNLAYWSRQITLNWYIIHPVQRTFEQMKSSGHLRLIKDKDVANGVSDYYSSLSGFDGYNEAGMLWAADYVKSMGKIFDAELLRNIMLKGVKLPASPSDMLTDDPIVINEFINSLQYFNGALVLGEGISKVEEKKAQQLINLIQKKSGL